MELALCTCDPTAILQGTISVPIVQMRKVKLRKDEQLVQNHLGQSWDLNPPPLSPESILSLPSTQILGVRTLACDSGNLGPYLPLSAVISGDLDTPLTLASSSRNGGDAPR